MPATFRYCTGCSRPVTVTTRFCPHCGTAMDDSGRYGGSDLAIAGDAPSQDERFAFGRSVTGATVLSLFGLGLLLALTSASGADPDDPGLVDVALFASPFLAALSALVLGLVVLALAAVGRIHLSVRRASAALIGGLLLGPIAYLISFYALWFGLGSDANALLGGMMVWPFSFLTFLLPVACGTGVVAVIDFN